MIVSYIKKKSTEKWQIYQAMQNVNKRYKMLFMLDRFHCNHKYVMTSKPF